MSAPATADVYAVLQSIDVTLKHLLALAELRGRKADAGKPVADDKELDGRYGNPEIKAKDPRDWHGPSMMGKTFSECPPDYLDLLAQRLDYFNTQLGDGPDDRKKQKYNAFDAAKARGWAARKRAGWQPKTASPETPHATPNPFAARDSIDF